MVVLQNPDKTSTGRRSPVLPGASRHARHSTVTDWCCWSGRAARGRLASPVHPDGATGVAVRRCHAARSPCRYLPKRAAATARSCSHARSRCASETQRAAQPEPAVENHAARPHHTYVACALSDSHPLECAQRAADPRSAPTSRPGTKTFERSGALILGPGSYTPTGSFGHAFGAKPGPGEWQLDPKRPGSAFSSRTKKGKHPVPITATCAFSHGKKYGDMNLRSTQADVPGNDGRKWGKDARKPPYWHIPFRAYPFEGGEPRGREPGCVAVRHRARSRVCAHTSAPRLLSLSHTHTYTHTYTHTHTPSLVSDL